jgi:hypothetical protein
MSDTFDHYGDAFHDNEYRRDFGEDDICDFVPGFDYIDKIIDRHNNPEPEGRIDSIQQELDL